MFVSSRETDVCGAMRDVSGLAKEHVYLASATAALRSRKVISDRDSFRRIGRSLL